MTMEQTETVPRQKKAWRTTGKDRDNPQPDIYPVCATCDAPWVYRRFLSFKTGSYVWAWARDCKHKGQPRVEGQDDA